MCAEQVFERLRLGFADLGELTGDVTDRAVMLAELRTRVTERGGRCIAVGAEESGERVEPIARAGLLVDACAIARDHFGGSLPCKAAHSLVATRCSEVAQRADGDVVVGDIEDVTALIGEGEDTGGTSAASNRPRAVGPSVCRDDESIGGEGLEVAAYDGRAAVQARGKLNGSRRTADEKGTSDPLGTGPREFHTPSVSEFSPGATPAPRLPGCPRRSSTM